MGCAPCHTHIYHEPHINTPPPPLINPPPHKSAPLHMSRHTHTTSQTSCTLYYPTQNTPPPPNYIPGQLPHKVQGSHQAMLIKRNICHLLQYVTPVNMVNSQLYDHKQSTSTDNTLINTNYKSNFSSKWRILC